MWKVKKFKQSLLVAVTSLEFDSSKPNLTQIALIFENIILMSGACGPYLEDWQQCRERHLKGHTRYFYPMFSWDTRWSLASLLFLSSEHENKRAGCDIPNKRQHFTCSIHLISKLWYSHSIYNRDTTKLDHAAEVTSDMSGFIIDAFFASSKARS